jgi:hypothetical protein
MAEEREVYRIKIHEFVPKIDGTCIVTNLRVIVRWDHGEVAQYPFGQIRSVTASNDVRHVYFQKRPGVVIELINGKHLTYETPEARKLASSIQNVMIPF